MRIALLLAILAGLLVASGALAMSSANFRLDWFVPLSGGGSPERASANYAAYVTYGQSAIRSGASANYQAGLGFWHGILEADIEPPPPLFTTQLPMLIKN
jgi:hypothetical protein